MKHLMKIVICGTLLMPTVAQASKEGPASASSPAEGSQGSAAAPPAGAPEAESNTQLGGEGSQIPKAIVQNKVLPLLNSTDLASFAATCKGNAECVRKENELRATIMIRGMVYTKKNIKDLKVTDLYLDNVTDTQMSLIVLLPNLEELDLGKSNITKFGLMHLMKLTKLKRFTIVDQAFDDETFVTLAQHLPPTLVDLRILNIPIRKAGAMALARNLPRLRDLVTLKFLNCNIDEDGLAALAEGLPNSLEILSFEHNKIKDATGLSRNLAKLTSLKHFSIILNPLTQAAAVGIVQNLPATVISLELHSNVLGEEGQALLIRDGFQYKKDGGWWRRSLPSGAAAGAATAHESGAAPSSSSSSSSSSTMSSSSSAPAHEGAASSSSSSSLHRHHLHLLLQDQMFQMKRLRLLDKKSLIAWIKYKLRNA